MGNKWGGRESHNSSRCNKTANICRAASVANKWLPLKERARRLLINGWLPRADSAGLPVPPSPVFCLQIPSVRDNRQDAPLQLVTLQRSGRSLLSERAVCSLPPTPTCSVPGTEPATRWSQTCFKTTAATYRIKVIKTISSKPQILKLQSTCLRQNAKYNTFFKKKQRNLVYSLTAWLKDDSYTKGINPSYICISFAPANAIHLFQYTPKPWGSSQWGLRSD